MHKLFVGVFLFEYLLRFFMCVLLNKIKYRKHHVYNDTCQLLKTLLDFSKICDVKYKIFKFTSSKANHC